MLNSKDCQETMVKFGTQDTRLLVAKHSETQHVGCSINPQIEARHVNLFEQKARGRGPSHLLQYDKFPHAGATPFGITRLGRELGHTGDTPMADAIYNDSLYHPVLVDRAIWAIVDQLKEHPILQLLIDPVVTLDDDNSCFRCVAEEITSYPSGCHTATLGFNSTNIQATLWSAIVYMQYIFNCDHP
jgi:hypothetical protein